MFFKVGDKVILDNLNEDIPENPGVVHDVMEAMLGGVFTIIETDIDQGRWVRLEEDPREYLYAREWFIPADGKRKKVKKPPMITEKAIPGKMRQIRKSMKEKASATSTASYAVLTDQSCHYFPNDICHARMKHFGPKCSKILALFDIHNKWKNVIPKEYHEAYKMAVRYIISESAWNKAFLSKNHVNFLQHGVFLDLTQPTSFVAQAVMALRMPKERRERLPLFEFLKKKGVSGDIAYLMFMSFERSSKKDGTYSLSIPGGHSPINGDFCIQKFFSFLKGDMSLFRNDKPMSEPGVWGIFYRFEGKYPGKGEYREHSLNLFFRTRMEGEDYAPLRKKGKGMWGADYYYYNEEALLKIAAELQELMEKVKV